jgi:hypothetical protein
MSTLKAAMDLIPAESWGQLFLISTIAVMALFTIVPTEEGTKKRKS